MKEKLILQIDAKTIERVRNLTLIQRKNLSFYVENFLNTISSDDSFENIEIKNYLKNVSLGNFEKPAQLFQNKELKAILSEKYGFENI